MYSQLPMDLWPLQNIHSWDLKDQLRRTHYRLFDKCWSNTGLIASRWWCRFLSTSTQHTSCFGDSRHVTAQVKTYRSKSRVVSLPLPVFIFSFTFGADWGMVLRPTRHNIGHFGDILPSQSLGVVLKNLNLTQQKQTRMWADAQRDGRPAEYS